MWLNIIFRYYDKTSKTWRDDDALSVVDISLEVQSDQRAQEALARRQAEVILLTY